MAGSTTEGKSHVVSNLYFSIMRDLVQTWKQAHPGVKSILKHPTHELFPKEPKKKHKIRFDEKIQLILSHEIHDQPKAEEATKPPKVQQQGTRRKSLATVPETEQGDDPKSGAPQFWPSGLSDVHGRVTKTVKKGLKIMEAKPETLTKMCENFQSCAQIVQFKVNSPFGTESCCCCHKQLCQTYAVMFSQLKVFAYRIVYHFVAYCLSKRSAQPKVGTAPVKNDHEIVKKGILMYIVQRARMMNKLGRPQNNEAIIRLQQEIFRTEREAPEIHSLGSLDSLDRCRNNPVLLESSDEDEQPSQNDNIEYTAFKFGRRHAHHGLVKNWTHAPYPFTKPLLPPLELSWPKDDAEIAGSDKRVKVALPPTESSVDIPEYKPGIGDEDGTDGLLETVILKAQEELRKEAEWVMGLKESLAAAVAFARIDVLKELENPLLVSQTDDGNL